MINTTSETEGAMEDIRSLTDSPPLQWTKIKEFKLKKAFFALNIFKSRLCVYIIPDFFFRSTPRVSILRGLWNISELNRQSPFACIGKI